MLHLIASGFYGGPERQIVQHLKRLNSGEYKGLLVSFNEYGMNNEVIEKARSEGLACWGIPMYGPLDIRAQWQLNALLDSEKVDLLCVHGYKACVMGWWYGIRSQTPIIAFSRGYTCENRKMAFYNWLERQVIRRLKFIICVSEGQKRRLISLGINAERIKVVHNATFSNALSTAKSSETKEIIRERLGVPKDAMMIVAAGRLSPEKGHKYLIEAAVQVKRKRTNVFFVFCGDGPCRRNLEAQARVLGVGEMCLFPGFRRDLPEIFQAMDLMVLPSLSEGLPNVVLEAFSSSKPVVATAVGGVPEVVEDAVNGLLVPPERADLLANAIERCLESPELMRQMGDMGRKKVTSAFTFESQTRKIEAIYREVLGL